MRMFNHVWRKYNTMVYIILGKGFEPMEAVAPCDILRRGGVEVCFAGIGGKLIEGGHGISVQADCTVEQMKLADTDMVLLPGGLGGVESILGCQAALDAVKRAWDGGKYVAAICAGPTVLAKLGITAGRRATCYPGCETQMPGTEYTPVQAQQDGKLITGQAPGASFAFGLKLLAALRGEQTAADVAEGMVIRG